MRILAIRGCNLTSLDGRFAVEFDREPLRRAGLFAITGPTGAGKSTILDALCLALFDRMPRLPEGNGVLLGPEGDPNAIRSTDVRAVLRRGAGSGWAEVDFVGTDGESYRARWELRRARQKATGAFQNQEMSLTSLDGTRRFGDKKKSVLEEIERRLGLSFEQFRRAVLLAQGDFATFLKAPPKDRSALLELLTGTEIYSRISIKAHERAAQEQRALEMLEAQCGGIRVLEDEERAVLELEAAGADAAVRETDARAAAARAVVAWYARDAQLEVAERAAAETAVRAEEIWQAAEPRRAEATLLRRLQVLRPLLAAADRTTAERDEAEAAARRAEDALAERKTALEAETDRHGDARRSFEAASLALRDAEPLLGRATDLDGQIAALTEEMQTAQAARLNADKQLSTSLNHCRETEKFLSAARDDAAERTAWLEENRWLDRVAEQASRWDAVLARHAAAMDSLGQAERDAKRHADATAALDGNRDALLAARTGASARLAEAEAVQAGIAAEPLPAAEAVRDRRLELNGRRDRLLGALTLAATIRRCADERAEAEARRTRSTAEAEAGETGARESGERLRQRRAALDEAESALRRLQLARREDVGSLRAQLVEGEACPVCGSAEHPWAAEAGPLARLAHDQEDRVAALKDEVTRLSHEHGGFEAAAKAARAQVAAVAERLTALHGESAGLLARWAAEAVALGLPEVPDAGAAQDALAVTEAALEDVDADEETIRGHRSRLDAAATRVKACVAVLAEAGAAVEDWQRKAAETRHALALAEAARERAGRDRDEALAELEPAFADWPGWREALHADPGRFRRQVTARASEWTGQRDALARATRRVEDLTAALAAARTAEGTARDAAEAARVRAEALSARLGGLRQERETLLDGRPVAAVRGELNAALQRAQALVERATLARQDAAARLSAAEQDLLNRREAAERCAAKAAEAAEALTRAADDCGTGVDEARQRLAVGETELAAEEKALAEIGTARRETALLAAERTRQRQEHRAAGVPEAGAEEAQAAAAALTADLEGLRDRLGVARGRLTADAEARARLADVLAAVAAQRERCRLWAALGQLIGSATGHKFRNFAQSLSLDTLLTHANRYLDELARRYRLERVTGADLEIQVVDREMGDERRGVHSLSGGELFLVSLALALGLSAMAAGTSGGIGTLFIDEGFGTLDPDSLDVALSCLEALQATGRQVGVISHVPAMVERIGVQVRVAPLGGGRSRVSVQAAGAVIAEPEPAEA